jgi:hypothetical protein
MAPNFWETPHGKLYFHRRSEEVRPGVVFAYVNLVEVAMLRIVYDFMLQMRLQSAILVRNVGLPKKKKNGKRK